MTACPTPCNSTARASMRAQTPATRLSRSLLSIVNVRFRPDASFHLTRAPQKMAEAEGSLIAERTLVVALIVHGAPPPELPAVGRDPCPAIPRICQRHASEIRAACPVTAERHLGCVLALSFCPFLSHSPSTRLCSDPLSEMSTTATAVSDRWSAYHPGSGPQSPVPTFEELYGPRRDVQPSGGGQPQGWMHPVQEEKVAPAKGARKGAMASVRPTLRRGQAKDAAVPMIDMTMARHGHVPPFPHAMSFAQLDMYANFAPMASSSQGQSASARDGLRRKPLKAMQPALQQTVSIASTTVTASAVASDSSTSTSSGSASAPSASDSSARSSDRDSVFTATTASTGSGSASSFTLARDDYVPTYGRGGAARHYARQAGTAGGQHSYSASTIGACDTQSLMSEFMTPFDTQAVGKSGGKVFLEGLLGRVKRDKGKAKAREGALIVETRLDGTWTSRAAEAAARAEGRAAMVYGRGGAGRMASELDSLASPAVPASDLG